MSFIGKCILLAAMLGAITACKQTKKVKKNEETGVRDRYGNCSNGQPCRKAGISYKRTTLTASTSDQTISWSIYGSSDADGRNIRCKIENMSPRPTGFTISNSSSDARVEGRSNQVVNSFNSSFNSFNANTQNYWAEQSGTITGFCRDMSRCERCQELNNPTDSNISCSAMSGSCSNLSTSTGYDETFSVSYRIERSNSTLNNGFLGSNGFGGGGNYGSQGQYFIISNGVAQVDCRCADSSVQNTGGNFFDNILNSLVRGVTGSNNGLFGNNSNCPDPRRFQDEVNYLRNLISQGQIQTYSCR